MYPVVQGRAQCLMSDGHNPMNASPRRRKKTRRKQNTELQNQIQNESHGVERSTEQSEGRGLKVYLVNNYPSPYHVRC